MHQYVRLKAPLLIEGGLQRK
eukprot:SAG11_NODE_38410_length_252_cov_1.006536_1_plen_20_part_10